MILKNKKLLIVTSILTLAPILVGLFLWDRLPQVADGWNPSPFFAFAPALAFLAAHWLCVLITFLDRSNDDRNQKVQKLVLWIFPLLSWMVTLICLGLMLGYSYNISQVMVVFLGVLFLVLGNYMPKCRMNSTIGIKVPWTYTSEDNWNATHRLTGWLWMVGGGVILLCAFLPEGMGIAVMLLTLIPMVLIPMVYSYVFYKKEKAAGKPLLSHWGTTDPRLLKGSLILVLVILAGVSALMFTGDIQVQYGQDSFTIEASYHEDLTVRYDAIDSMEYRQENIPGSRTMGYGSPRLLMGYFENEEFGGYIRYTYTNPGAGIIIHCGSRVLVLSGKDTAETQAIYQELLTRTGK